MAGFPKSQRLAIIADYLNQSGENVFHPEAFVRWLGERPGHPVYDLFYSKTDQEAALQYRVLLVRNWVSGLKITVANVDAKGVNVGTVSVLPAMTSRFSTRQHGGGYTFTDVNDAGCMSDLGAEAAQSLTAWLGRYEGYCEMHGVDVSALVQVITALEGQEAQAA